MDGASERFSECGVLEWNVVRDDERVLGDNAGRNADELGISAVVEEQVVAEILLPALAEVALAAGSRIESDNATAVGKALDPLPRLDDCSGQLVTEESGRNDHTGMIATTKDFEIRSTGEGSANAHDQFTGARPGNGHVFDANVLASVEDCGLHGSLAKLARGLDGIAANLNDLFNCASANVEDFLDGIAADLENISDGTSTDLEDIFDGGSTALYRVWHYFAPEPETGSIMIFIESALGCDATSIAGTASSIGKRCEMS
jgi:hypothetical protein